jgi:hypothetical protein
LPESIQKLQPDRTLALRGFDGFASAAAIHHASPDGFTVTGTFRDPADFAVAVLYDADNFYEHPRLKYLPDFDFSGLTLSFNLRYSDGLQPIDSPKSNWIDWATLDCMGHSLELHNVEFSGAGGNFPTHANGTYTVTDLSGNNPLTLFQWASSYSTAGTLGGTPVPTGPVDIYGIVDIFDGTPEFVPFSITPAAASTPEPGSAGLILVGVIAAQLLLRRWIAAPDCRLS